MAIIVLQHSEENAPGRLGAALRDSGHVLDIRRLDLGDGVPPLGGDPGDPMAGGVAGVVSLGGPRDVPADGPADGPGWADAPAWMRDERDCLRAAHQRGIPIVGVGLGHQMLAAALGGTVGPMQRPRVGVERWAINPAGQVEPMLAGVPWDAPFFVSHACEVQTLPPGAQLLVQGATGTGAANVQVFRAGTNAYGFQCHLEADDAIVDAMLRADAQMAARAGVAAVAVRAQMHQRGEACARAAERLCARICAILMPAGSALRG